jgi:hypothetical protein
VELAFEQVRMLARADHDGDERRVPQRDRLECPVPRRVVRLQPDRVGDELREQIRRDLLAVLPRAAANPPERLRAELHEDPERAVPPAAGLQRRQRVREVDLDDSSGHAKTRLSGKNRRRVRCGRPPTVAGTSDKGRRRPRARYACLSVVIGAVGGAVYEGGGGIYGLSTMTRSSDACAPGPAARNGTFAPA